MALPTHSGRLLGVPPRAPRLFSRSVLTRGPAGLPITLQGRGDSIFLVSMENSGPWTHEGGGVPREAPATCPAAPHPPPSAHHSLLDGAVQPWSWPWAGLGGLLAAGETLSPLMSLTHTQAHTCNLTHACTRVCRDREKWEMGDLQRALRTLTLSCPQMSNFSPLCKALSEIPFFPL